MASMSLRGPVSISRESLRDMTPLHCIFRMFLGFPVSNNLNPSVGVWNGDFPPYLGPFAKPNEV